MKIIPHCEPNTPPLTWHEFKKHALPRSIAIDGYVTGPTKFDPKTSKLNANHHEGVDRFSTRCTASQLALQIRTGLLSAFPGNESIHVFFNDCDQDVCLSLWLLRNAMISRNIVNPILNRIIFIEDMLDTTAGAYGFPSDMPGLMENNWIFEPYAIARTNGALARRNHLEFMQVIDAVGARIDQTITGHGQRLDLDPRYTLIKKLGIWSMVQEIGLNARTGMFGDGIRAFLSVSELDNGRYKYSIGRSGLWIPFNIPLILKSLNNAENDPTNKWGGGDTIGGSPRATGSKLDPDKVTSIIQSCI